MFFWGCEQYGNKGPYPCKSFSVTSTFTSLLLSRESPVSFSSWPSPPSPSCSLPPFALAPAFRPPLRFGGDRHGRRRPLRQPPPLPHPFPPWLPFRSFFLAQETTFDRAIPHQDITSATSWPIIAFRFISPIIEDSRSSTALKKTAIYVHTILFPFIPFFLRLRRTAAKISKTSTVVQTHWPDNGDYPPVKEPAHVSSR